MYLLIYFFVDLFLFFEKKCYYCDGFTVIIYVF